MVFEILMMREFPREMSGFRLTVLVNVDEVCGENPRCSHHSY